MNEAIALYNTTSDHPVPLVSTRIDGFLHDLMSNITVEQTFRNTESRSIEAVYSFPLPHRAELMALRVTLGERTLEGVVQPAPDAGEKYEEAISEGDGAILLQKISEDDNLYTMNVGNIRPDETVVIIFEYALLNQLQGNQLRFSIPTTISPRYGNSHRAGFEPHQIPQASLSVEHRYSLTLRIAGLFQNATIECPTHTIRETRSGEANEIILNGDRAFLDRDFVLNIYPDQTTSATATSDRDFEGYAVMASFVPRLPVFDNGPKDIRIVIDCSGSMGGDSITQAAEALKTILDELHATDVFNIVLFGSDHFLLFPEPVKASKSNIAKARKLVRGLDAGMGGTEMGNAIRVASRMKSDVSLVADILLITDGEVYEHGPIIDEIRESGHRVFSVGVGSGVAEAFIRNIADVTGGMAEFVTPNEGMAGHIVRQFQRIYSPRAGAKLIWPDGVTNQSPARLPALYSGDTIHVFGWSRNRPQGEVELQLTVHDTSISVRAPIVSSGSGSTVPSTVARLAARSQLENQQVDDPVAHAVRYQLMTDQTSYIVVDKRDSDEKTDGDPGIRKVPQMLTAGWGGTSSVGLNTSIKRLSIPSITMESQEIAMLDDICDLMLTDDDEEDRYEATPWEEFCSNILDLLNRDEYRQLRVEDLASFGVARWIVELLKSLKSNGYSDEEIISVFLMRLVRLRLKDRVSEYIFADLKRYQPAPLPPGLTEVLTSVIKAIEKDMGDPDFDSGMT